MKKHRLFERAVPSVPNYDSNCFIISLPLPVEHPETGCSMRRSLEIDGGFIAPHRGGTLQVAGLSTLPVASVTWEPRYGRPRQIVTIDVAPTGKRIPLDEQKLIQEHNYRVFTN